MERAANCPSQRTGCTEINRIPTGLAGPADAKTSECWSSLNAGRIEKRKKRGKEARNGYLIWPNMPEVVVERRFAPRTIHFLESRVSRTAGMMIHPVFTLWALGMSTPTVPYLSDLSGARTRVEGRVHAGMRTAEDREALCLDGGCESLHLKDHEPWVVKLSTGAIGAEISCLRTSSAVIRLMVNTYVAERFDHFLGL